MSNLFDKLATGEMGLGVWIKGGPSWVSTIARAGFDFVRPDMMFSAIDWRELPTRESFPVNGSSTEWPVDLPHDSNRHLEPHS